jgi:hypothetical protein
LQSGASDGSTCSVDCAPRQREAEHVAQAVPRVGDEGHRVRQDPVDDLGDDEAEIQRDADREPSAEARRRGVPVRVLVQVIVSVRLVVSR